MEPRIVRAVAPRDMGCAACKHAAKRDGRDVGTALHALRVDGAPEWFLWLCDEHEEIAGRIRTPWPERIVH